MRTEVSYLLIKTFSCEGQPIRVGRAEGLFQTKAQDEINKDYFRLGIMSSYSSKAGNDVSLSLFQA